MPNRHGTSSATNPSLMPLAAYAESLAKSTAFACVFFTDEEERPLQLHSVYSPDHPWHLPGGNVEAGERPWEAAVRECHEETGITPAGPPRLLTSVFGLPGGDWPYSSVGFVFDGGRLTDQQIQDLTLSPNEHDQALALDPEAWEGRMPAKDYARLHAAVRARSTGAATYFDAWDWGI